MTTRGIRHVCAACAAAYDDEAPVENAKMALAEAMFKARYSDPNSDGVDREWMKYRHRVGYHEGLVMGLLNSLGYELTPSAESGPS